MECAMLFSQILLLSLSPCHLYYSDVGTCDIILREEEELSHPLIISQFRR